MAIKSPDSGANTLDFSNTVVTDIAEVNASGGSDTVIASNLSNMFVRGGSGNDTLIAGNADVTWLYDSNNNNYDTFINGIGISTIIAEETATIIGFRGYDNGVDGIFGHISGNTIIKDSGANTLDFSNTVVTDIAEVNAHTGSDIVIASNLSEMSIRGGQGNDTLIAGEQTVTFLYGSVNNGFDSFTNGIGNSTIQVEATNTVIGFASNFINDVDTIDVNNQTKALIRGSSGSDIWDLSQVDIQNNPGDLIFHGRGGSDIITGNRGNDFLTGGSEADTFVFAGAFDTDTITDFQVKGADKIDLSDFGLTYAEVQGLISDDNTNATIDLSGEGGGTILIKNFLANQFSASDFIGIS